MSLKIPRIISEHVWISIFWYISAQHYFHTHKMCGRTFLWHILRVISRKTCNNALNFGKYLIRNIIVNIVGLWRCRKILVYERMCEWGSKRLNERIRREWAREWERISKHLMHDLICANYFNQVQCAIKVLKNNKKVQMCDWKYWECKEYKDKRLRSNIKY